MPASDSPQPTSRVVAGRSSHSCGEVATNAHEIAGRYRQIIEHANGGVWIIDAESNTTTVNDRMAEMLGYAVDEMLGMHLFAFMDERGRQIAERNVERRRQGIKEQHDFEFVRKDGERILASLDTSPISSDEGGYAGAIALVTDVTERRRAEAAARHLASIVESISDAVLSTDAVGGVISWNPEASRLFGYSGNEAVSEISALLEVSLSKRAMLQLDLSSLPLFVEADVTQLRQVLMNLITNASEAIRDKSGVIRVTTGTTTVDADYLESAIADPEVGAGTFAFVEISDTGCGMDAETVGKIFDPFFTSKFTGRGLGLAAVLGIVRGHGGAVRVYSEPSRGSSFKVLFPLADPPEDESSVCQAGARASTRGVVLVVDDEPYVLRFASRALSRSEYEVITANGGEEALTRFRAERSRIVAIVLDMTMPDMDGKETYSELRRIDQDVPVILSSGFNEQETTSELAGRGLAAFLAKPYSVNDLLTCLRDAISNSKP